MDGMCTIVYIRIQFRNLNEITKIIKFIQMFIYSTCNNILYNLLLMICSKTVVFFAQTEMHNTFYAASSTAFSILQRCPNASTCVGR